MRRFSFPIYSLSSSTSTSFLFTRSSSSAAAWFVTANRLQTSSSENGSTTSQPVKASTQSSSPTKTSRRRPPNLPHHQPLEQQQQQQQPVVITTNESSSSPSSSATATATSSTSLHLAAVRKGPKAKRSPSPVSTSSSSSLPPEAAHPRARQSVLQEVEEQQQKQKQERKRSPDSVASPLSAPSQLTETLQTPSQQHQMAVPIRTTMSAALAEKKEHDKKMLAKGTEVMSSLPTIVKVFEQMDPDTRRYIVVAAASEEWFGTPEVKSKLKEADQMADQRICATDYEQWIAMSMRKRLEQIPRPHFWTLVAVFGAPFFAMGCLDNCLFCLAGDVFDHLLWNYFGVTGMVCAGLAGIVSGTVGLQVHGVAVRLISRTVKMPETTKAQKHSASYKTAKHWGGVFGLVLGLTAGCTPLLLLSGGSRKE